jgi:hypothetical protein
MRITEAGAPSDSLQIPAHGGPESRHPWHRQIPEKSGCGLTVNWLHFPRLRSSRILRNPSCRVSHFDFHPEHWPVHYVAMAGGNIWKTQNNGMTWEAVFENEGAYSIQRDALAARGGKTRGSGRATDLRAEAAPWTPARMPDWPGASE